MNKHDTDTASLLAAIASMEIEKDEDRRTIMRLEVQYSVLNGMYQKTKEDLEAAKKTLAAMEKRDQRYQRLVDFLAREMS